MKNYLLSLFTGLFFVSNLEAQNQFCGTAQKNLPNKTTTDFSLKSNTGENSTYIIPVVVHILHLNGEEKISANQVKSAIKNLNEDFNAANADIVSVNPIFKNIIGNAKVEFRLAKLDPQGNPTEGVEWIVSQETNDGWNGNPHINQWPTNMYLNIWTVKSMNNPNVAAYALYPDMAVQNPEMDGIVSTYNYFGSVETASPDTSHVVPHEVGHYFNLIHPWGDVSGCAGTDYVTDTPQTSSNLKCNPPYNICNAGVTENYQNLMTGNYGCFNMFTQGQVDRMHATLESNVAGRSNLWKIQNLIATGVYQPLAAVDTEKEKIQVHPNPTSDYVTVSGLIGNEEVKISDFSGKLLKVSKTLSSNQLKVSLKDYSKGVYVLSIYDGKMSKSFKVVRN